MLRFAARAASALALAGALVLAATAPAPADPTVTPNAQDLVGLGAQATEGLFTQLSGEYNASLAAAGDVTSSRLHSWDSSGTSNVIVPKYGATTIYRPWSTDTGLKALTYNTKDTVDFVRATRPPKPTDPVDGPTNLPLSFIAVAKDAVSWAAPAGGNAPTTLTPAQLTAIFSCKTTRWSQISPLLPNTVIRPVVSGDVTVDYYGVHGTGLDATGFFLEKIGYAQAVQDLTFDHSCVSVVARENQGTDPILQNPDALVPYSVGRYVGQAYGGHSTPGDEPGVLTPRAINGVVPVTTAHVINPAFTATPFGRMLSAVVRPTEWTAQDAHGTALRAVFGPSGWICQQGQAVVSGHGFQSLPSFVCGTIVH
ncbi:substrate-binding domain-containing protein [Kitasatospora sp. NPDC057965]|uniref:substrate-binding domain-containing protein n=1 Tax=Kitasatospora sp. NPDC057965 TaxID=3346291 RepID=UPI0036DAAB15